MSQNVEQENVDKDTGFLIFLMEKGEEMISGLGDQFCPDKKKLADLRNRLSEGRFHLAVLGQFKRGKSTLLNALVGEPVLPVSVVPLTAVPTFIQFGKVPAIRVHYGKDRSPEEFSGASTRDRTAFLVQYVTEEGNPKNNRGVTQVEVELPAPILSRGVVLIDTPGIGSTYRHNTQATLGFLQQCDAALFLISSDPPITEVELDFLRQVREKVPRLFFVLNKIDYLDADERSQVLSFSRRVLTEQLQHSDNLKIFPLSARSGLQAKLEENRQVWRESGVEELETHLIDFLAREKLSALEEAVSRRALDCVESVLMGVRISLKALQLPRERLEETIAVFGKSLAQAERDRTLIQDLLEGDKKRLAAFLEDQAGRLREESKVFLQQAMNCGLSSRSVGKSSGSRVQDAWAESIPEFFEQKQAQLNERVKARLLEALAAHDQRTGRLIETLRKSAADLFNVPYRPLQGEEALDASRRPYWVLNAWNTEALPMLKSMDQRLDDLVRRNVENLRWSTLQNINISFARFATRIRERLDETVRATKGAMETVDSRKKAHGETAAEEILALGRAVDALEALKNDLECASTKCAGRRDDPVAA